MPVNAYRYPLVVGLPHTSRFGLSEPQLLMQAGHFQWNSLATAFRKPLSQILTKEGKPIYATFFYIEEDFPAERPLAGFELDQELLFLNRIRHYKGMAVDGTLIFDLKERLGAKTQATFAKNPSALMGKHPFIRLCNVFISREGGNDFLKITAPESSISFNRIPPLPPEENSYGITREAARNFSFGLFDSGWRPANKLPDFSIEHAVDADRDTNAAGLIYFAQYVAFLVTLERTLLLRNSTLGNGNSEALQRPRTLMKRRLGYYGNARLDDTLQLIGSVFVNERHELGFRCKILRKSDGKLIVLSESVQAFVDNAIEADILKRTC